MMSHRSGFLRLSDGECRNYRRWMKKFYTVARRDLSAVVLTEERSGQPRARSMPYWSLSRRPERLYHQRLLMGSANWLSGPRRSQLSALYADGAVQRDEIWA